MTADEIAAAAAANDIPMLQRAFLAFVDYPVGEGLSGFDSCSHMVEVFTDTVCTRLFGDMSQMPDATYQTLLEFALLNHGMILAPSFHDGAALGIARWQGFADRFGVAQAA